MMICIGISTLIMGLGFKAFESSNKVFIKFRKNAAIKEEWMAFINAFENDTRQSEMIFERTGNYVFLNYQAEIEYSISPDFVIRKNRRIDSFRVTHLLIRASAEGNKLLNKIRIEIPLQNDSLIYEFKKEYSCADRLNAENKFR